jgi:hypothetical protein
MGAALSGGRCRGSNLDAQEWSSAAATASGGSAAEGGREASAGAPGVGHAANQRRATALRGARGARERGAAAPARGGAHPGDTDDDTRARPRTSSLRAGGAEPAVAVGHLHLPLATARAAVPGGLHGRSLAVPRVVRAGAPPAHGAGDGSAVAGDRGLRGAEGGADGQRAAVHGVARGERIRAGATPQRHRAQ